MTQVPLLTLISDKKNDDEAMTILDTFLRQQQEQELAEKNLKLIMEEQEKLYSKFQNKRNDSK
jgi:hypothetical protein